MNRVTLPGTREAIERAVDLFPTAARPLLRFDVLAGVDPVFAGLHRYTTTDDGRSYAATAHVCYPWHVAGPAARRRTTLVLPTVDALELPVLVHELGHVLDYNLGRDLEARPGNTYAATDRDEAFAEAIRAALLVDVGRLPSVDRDHAFEARLAAVLEP